MVGPFLTVDGFRLEAAWHGPPPGVAVPLVFLHEGLGSVSSWRDVPATLAARTGRGALVTSRAGYGRSDARPLPWPLDYMEREGASLPALLDAAGIDEAILVGHSDGASIALVAAALAPERVRGLVLEAPHVMCEDVSVETIAKVTAGYEESGLRARLARHHDHVDVAFGGWSGAWLDPGFRAFDLRSLLPRVRAPTLIIQGRDDAYGTLAQMDAVAAGVSARIDALVLDACGHAPHVEQRERTLDAIVDFVRSVP